MDAKRRRIQFDTPKDAEGLDLEISKSSFDLLFPRIAHNKNALINISWNPETPSDAFYERISHG